MSIGSIISGIGAGIGALVSSKNAQKNINAQQQFAKKGIQWRVEDALAAGIHPLYALGAQTHSFSPVDASGVAGGIGQMGQDLGRAVDSMRTTPEKLTAFTAMMQNLQLERGGLENELLRSQIARMNQAGVMPPAPSPTVQTTIPGQTSSGLVPETVAPAVMSTLPFERDAVSPQAPHAEPGPISDIGYVDTPTGRAPVMSNSAKQRLEEDLAGTILWNLRNRVLPEANAMHMKTDRGTAWYWHPWYQEYRKVKLR